MSKFIAVVFPDDAGAYEGTRVLRELHTEGSLTVYAIAVITKDDEGKILVREAVDTGPLGTALGVVVGGLVGVLGGPVGMLAGVAGGAVVGGLGDLFELGIGADFLDKVSAALAPGKAAVAAEVAESWTVPLDARMDALGATVIRTWRTDFEDERIATEIAALTAEYGELKAEYVHAKDEVKAKLKAGIDRAGARLATARDRTAAKIETLDRETKAKIATLEKQFANAKAEKEAKLDQRIAALRTDHTARAAKLKQAWELTKEAIAA